MLVELGVVEQRTKAVYEVLDGADVVEVAKRYGVSRQTVHTWLREVTRTRVSLLLSTSPPSRTAVRTRCRPRSRPASSRCDASTPTGDRARSSTGSVVRASTRFPGGARSTGRLSVTASSSRESAGGKRRTTSAGNDRVRWSSGRWTSSAASTYETAPSSSA